MTGIKTYANMNHEIKKTLGFSGDQTDQYALARIEELEMESQRYKQALEFYADEKTYKVNVTDQWEPRTLIHDDNGEKARKALKEDENND